jgi:quercetin dioxygenase-like cupin family protein
LQGDLTFTVGQETIEVIEGDLVIIPAGVAHRFVTSESGRARYADIHASGQMITEWLEH